MTSLSRKFLITATTAVAALAITACSPALEVDSETKVNTATGVAAPSKSASTTGATTTGATTTAVADADLPGYIDCVAAPVQEPVSISLNCADNSDQLTDIDWESWDETGATGSGSRIILSPAGEEEVTEDVEVELSFPTATSQGLVFSQVTVEGVAVTL